MGALVDLAKGAALAGPEAEREPSRPVSEPEPVASDVQALAIHAGNLACDRCRNIRMVEEQRRSNPRRFFWFKCGKGHPMIEAAYHAERVLLAPASCNDHDPREVH